MEQLTEQQLQNCNNAGLGVALRMAMHQPVLAVGGEGRTIMAAAAKRLMELGDIRVMNMLDTDTGLFERALRMFPGENQAYEAMHDAQTEASVYKRQLETAQANYDSLNADLRVLAEQRAELQMQVNDLTRKLAETESNARAAQQRLVDQVDSLKSELRKCQDALDKAQKAAVTEQRYREQARAELQRRVEAEKEGGARWFWQHDGSDNLDSMVDDVQVIISAAQLRDLILPKREADGIRIVRAADYRGEDGSIQARYDVFDGKSGGSYQAITVWQRSAKQSEDRPHFAAVERRLLANAPAEPEVKPKRPDAEIVADVTEICRGIAREWKGDGLPLIGDNSEAFRNGPQPAQNIWRIACMIHKGKTGEDGEAAAAREADEIPF